MTAKDFGGSHEQSSARDHVPALSVRQREILYYLCRGYHNKTIADQLGIELVTVKMHVGRLFKKLHVNNRTAAAVRGVQLYAGGQRPRTEKP